MTIDEVFLVVAVALLAVVLIVGVGLERPKIGAAAWHGIVIVLSFWYFYSFARSADSPEPGSCERSDTEPANRAKGAEAS